jgi:hypothetical protein
MWRVGIMVVSRNGVQKEILPMMVEIQAKQQAV